MATADDDDGVRVAGRPVEGQRRPAARNRRIPVMYTDDDVKRIDAWCLAAGVSRSTGIVLMCRRILEIDGYPEED